MFGGGWCTSIGNPQSYFAWKLLRLISTVSRISLAAIYRLFVSSQAGVYTGSYFRIMPPDPTVPSLRSTMLLTIYVIP